jgi:hypothetical protein
MKMQKIAASMAGANGGLAHRSGKAREAIEKQCSRLSRGASDDPFGEIERRGRGSGIADAAKIVARGVRERTAPRGGCLTPQADLEPLRRAPKSLASVDEYAHRRAPPASSRP